MATEATTPADLGHDQEPIVRDRLYIGGEWVEPSGGGTIDVIDATTEQVMGSVPEGDAADLDRAVQAARAAFDGWSQTPLEERVAACNRIAQGLAARSEEIAALVSREVGMPLPLSVMIQAGLPTMSFAAIPEVVAAREALAKEVPAWRRELRVIAQRGARQMRRARDVVG